ncbi:hypothetical protein A0H81_11562 [Grifola frondosa]|uniref:Uncharacterized protein n=1 Tax=Grifola frondosa TaxID=5627 RepID=A0A1C7LW35_GRIFR|nr:hypothetical protein A0H81_11562 [Grifola frondosa]
MLGEIVLRISALNTPLQASTHVQSSLINCRLICAMVSNRESQSSSASSVGIVPYVGDSFFIKKAPTVTDDIQCFVSIYGARGTDRWSTITTRFVDGQWGRGRSWELVAFKDANDSQRVGFYLSTKGKTTYITFHSFDRVEIVTSS